MPAIVKVSPSVLAGGVALVRYSVSQTSELLLTVEAEFVALPSSRDDLFKIGSPPPSSLLDAAGFVQTLQTYGAPSVPRLTDCQVVRSNGLKTVTATYTVTIAATTGGRVIRIFTDASGNVILSTDGSEETVGSVSGTGATNSGSTELVSGTIAPGTAFSEITVSTSWQSISGSYVEETGLAAGESFSFSADYVSTSVTVVATGNASLNSSGAQPQVSPLFNPRGRLPNNLASDVRSTTRSYQNSRGETRSEYTSAGYYYVV